MDGMWYKHCPKCGNYVKKIDPQESGMCNSCGWQEYVIVYYCEIRGRYCRSDADRSAA
jgi:hypothetical protein